MEEKLRRIWQSILGITDYDKDLITLAAQKKNIPKEKLEEVDEKRESPGVMPLMRDNMAMERQFHDESSK